MIIRQMIILGVTSFFIGVMANSDIDGKGSIIFSWIIIFMLGCFFTL